MKGDGCVNQIDSGNHFEVYTHAKTMPCTLNIDRKNRIIDKQTRGNKGINSNWIYFKDELTNWKMEQKNLKLTPNIAQKGKEIKIRKKI